MIGLQSFIYIYYPLAESKQDQSIFYYTLAESKQSQSIFYYPLAKSKPNYSISKFLDWRDAGSNASQTFCIEDNFITYPIILPLPQ